MDERRAPVQGDLGRGARPRGTISWWEHEKAWLVYDARYHTGQSAERVAERQGFSYGELVMFLGREPETWQTR